MADSTITVDDIEGELLKIDRIRDVLVRRESELRYMACSDNFGTSSANALINQSVPQTGGRPRKQMDDIQLCKEITRLKKELQKLISVPDKDKASEDRQREEELLQQIQKLVEARDYLVDDVEFERLREREEDKEMADFLKSKTAVTKNATPGRRLGGGGQRQRSNSAPSVTKTGLALLKECCGFTCTVM
ncbi:bMERB domain-containing protein 1 [Brachyhypopomus gauderio]|uniref:bMERB domain-containing protein 1 n=1 Tax=Brachyhypopomus gauderio TaxID=698409 RepID=UPI0040435CF9